MRPVPEVPRWLMLAVAAALLAQLAGCWPESPPDRPAHAEVMASARWSLAELDRIERGIVGHEVDLARWRASR